MREPLPGNFTAYVNANGNPVFVWVADGQTTPNGIRGIAVKDLGLTVKSLHDPENVQVSQSIKDNVIELWHESRIE